MHEQPGHERPGDTVPHQEEIDEIIEDRSKPPILTRIISAAEISEVWDDENSVAAIELTDIVVGDVIYFGWEDDSTLDQAVVLSNFIGYLSGASSSDVYNNGTTSNAYSTWSDAPDLEIGGNSPSSPERLVVDHSLYVLFNGSESPTVGQTTIRVKVDKKS